jgi:hypothetical protein
MGTCGAAQRGGAVAPGPVASRSSTPSSDAGMKHQPSSSGQQFPGKSWLFADFAFQLDLVTAMPLTLIVLYKQMHTSLFRAWHSFCVVLGEGH